MTRLSTKPFLNLPLLKLLQCVWYGIHIITYIACTNVYGWQNLCDNHSRRRHSQYLANGVSGGTALIYVIRSSKHSHVYYTTTLVTTIYEHRMLTENNMPLPWWTFVPSSGAQIHVHFSPINLGYLQEITTNDHDLLLKCYVIMNWFTTRADFLRWGCSCPSPLERRNQKGRNWAPLNCTY